MTDLPLEFHRDKHGMAKAVWSGNDETGHLLSKFFELELASDTTYCARLEVEAEKHSKGHATAWRTSGNSFAVTMEENMVSLRPLFGNEKNHEYVLDSSDFLALLHKWHLLVK